VKQMAASSAGAVCTRKGRCDLGARRKRVGLRDAIGEADSTSVDVAMARHFQRAAAFLFQRQLGDAFQMECLGKHIHHV
jgi:hypothetical protein